MKKKVLLMGASGLIGPYLSPGLEEEYDLHLADIAPHPDGKDIVETDMTSFQQVLVAARGMDALINCTVNRSDPVASFHVNTRGAWNVMKAAVELGIKKVIYTGPQYVRRTYDHYFDIDDVPRTPGTGHYTLTKMLGAEICAIYARAHDIQVISFVFNGLGEAPTQRQEPGDYPPFTVVWEDLQLACRLALEVKSVPDNFQEFNMLSYQGHGKYTLDKAQRLLGFEPTRDWTEYFARR
ncbi:MAG: NAD-dependent epimerase/dehydratase family protein [Candidatus Latescibacteria bacterium]|nr:NAD-dependent epimerase/dehydratase family protein [Candidatus Latescibacterota bacterium]